MHRRHDPCIERVSDIDQVILLNTMHKKSQLRKLAFFDKLFYPFFSSTKTILLKSAAAFMIRLKLSNSVSGYFNSL